MKLLDLFSCAGGATRGYQRAGFEVVGVDIGWQPDYCGDHFIRGDAIQPAVDLKAFDLIHASPPCQDYTPMTNRHASEQPQLIAPVRDLLEQSGVPYVIENVVGAGRHMQSPIVLTGEMFGLATTRRRLFELGGWWAFQPPIPPAQQGGVAVYGKPDGRRLWTRVDGSELRAWSSVTEGQRALGIDWTDSWHSLREAIPPAYTEWIGSRFLEQVTT